MLQLFKTLQVEKKKSVSSKKIIFKHLLRQKKNKTILNFRENTDFIQQKLISVRVISMQHKVKNLKHARGKLRKLLTLLKKSLSSLKLSFARHFST